MDLFDAVVSAPENAVSWKQRPTSAETRFDKAVARGGTVAAVDFVGWEALLVPRWMAVLRELVVVSGSVLYTQPILQLQALAGALTTIESRDNCRI